MNEEQTSLVQQLRALSAIDAKRHRLKAERLQLQNNLQQAKICEEKALQLYERAHHNASVIRDRLEKEETESKIEREKLKDRRKALGSFNNHKVQQNAAKEIERSERLLTAKEESALKLMEQLEGLEASEEAARETLEREKKVREEIEAELQDMATVLDERDARYEAEREKITPHIDARALQDYHNVLVKHPENPIVELDGDNCSGCYMILVRQMVLEVEMGDKIVRCRGCKRILCPQQTAA